MPKLSLYLPESDAKMVAKVPRGTSLSKAFREMIKAIVDGDKLPQRAAMLAEENKVLREKLLQIGKIAAVANRGVD